MMRSAVKDYQEALHLLTESGRYDTKDDFTVVVQPFFRETEIPKELNSGDTDLSYFAPDCFHFSVKGQQAAATALWKNMVRLDDVNSNFILF
ncbi:hypothetical protein KUTeg_014336 [Tegillarca granosa]|uniref:Phospholipase B1, membrane-associated n=1 Tax=Tegillarca granosa TaxID=220873 RepID=A0ABQ9F0Q6_TEGGR|nr:hypothetical protein KUTeg_014336 [Tegillarca granosa]